MTSCFPYPVVPSCCRYSVSSVNAKFNALTRGNPRVDAGTTLYAGTLSMDGTRSQEVIPGSRVRVGGGGSGSSDEGLG